MITSFNNVGQGLFIAQDVCVPPHPEVTLTMTSFFEERECKFIAKEYVLNFTTLGWEDKHSCKIQEC